MRRNPHLKHWSRSAKEGRRRDNFSLPQSAQRELEQLIRDTFGTDPFIFNANSDWEHTVLGPNAKQINVVEHGKNAHSSYMNVAFMPSLLPVPDKWQFLYWLGFQQNDIRDEYYHSHAYQTVFRTAARQQNRNGTVKAVLPARAACEYIQRKAPGAEIIVHDVLEPRAGPGRPAKHMTEDERRSANALRMRLKRQAAKNAPSAVPGLLL